MVITLLWITTVVWEIRVWSKMGVLPAIWSIRKIIHFVLQISLWIKGLKG